MESFFDWRQVFIVIYELRITNFDWCVKKLEIRKQKTKGRRQKSEGRSVNYKLRIAN